MEIEVQQKKHLYLDNHNLSQYVGCITYKAPFHLHHRLFILLQ